MRSVFIGIDFGTSVAKGTLLFDAGDTWCQVTTRYQDRSEQATPSGWTTVFNRILSELLRRPRDPYVIRCIAVTGMVPNVALVDHSGDELGSILFCEDSAYELELELNQQLNSAPWANEVLSKVLLITRRHGGRRFRWYSTHNWLVQQLTGTFVVDAVTASECGTLLGTTGCWDDSVMSEFGIPSTAFPEMVAPASIVGTVKSDHPIPSLRGVPVAAGTSDTVATALGAGWKNDAHSLLVYYGTFNCAAVISIGRDAALYGSRPSNPFSWLLSVPRAGDQLLQVAELIGDGDTNQGRLESIDRLASCSPPGCNGVVFLHADRIADTTVSTKPVASIRGLSPTHTRPDIARAVLEGFGYLLRHALEGSSLGPESFQTVLAAGGGARSAVWRQIVTDITGLTQQYRPAADRGMGSAMLAFAAAAPTEFHRWSGERLDEALATSPTGRGSYEKPYDHYRGYMR